MARWPTQQLDEFLDDGRCEFISAYSQPFAMLVVADLLGVPEEDHQRFRDGFGLSGTVGEVGAGEEGNPGENPLAWLDEWFTEYIEDRRRQPRSDVLTDLALATYPDGTTPDVTSVVRTSTFLFAAGQETTARLLAAAFKHLAEHPELQDELRADRDRIPDFLEEVLRVESPVKADFRLARRTTSIGGVEVTAGTPVMLLNGAANRDPRHFECPAEFRMDRPNAQSHIAFGRGVHSCPGGPLARAEGRVSVERILDRTRNIRLSEEHHGPPGDTALPVRAHLDTPRAHQVAPRVRCRSGGPMSRVAVVTGGASGIGLGVARRLAADGHRVAIVDRDGEAAEAAADELNSENVTAVAVDLDVADWAAVDAGFERVRAELGPVEILVTSAGIEAFTPVLDITADRWDRIIGVNLTGTFTCVQAALPDMISAGWGRIVTISSSSAQSGLRTWPTTRRPRVASSGSPRRWRSSSPAVASPSTRSRPVSSTPRWLGKPKPTATSPASTWSGPWSRSDGPAPRRTSPRRARSCAPTAAATSPAR